MSSEFEKLAEELELLAKAKGETADTVAASAEEAGIDPEDYAEAPVGADGGEGGDGGEDAGADVDADGGGADGEDAGADSEDDEVLGKSFEIETADGGRARAYDATALIKSLNERLVEVEAERAEEAERREHLGKSLELMTSLLKSQGEQINALSSQIESLRGEGRGRKAVLTVTEKPEPAMAKSQPEGIPASEFMAKALDAQRGGRISSRDVSIAEASLNRGVQVPEHIVRRVMGN